jgi:2-(1,2-epoxy-1,2-dihydrophenyl)acetyl-CoA isomerase
MSYQTILLSEEGGVSTITLNRPEVMNGLNATMRREITAAVTEASTGARVIVLTGAGRGFCSGQDLGDAKAMDATSSPSPVCGQPRSEHDPSVRAEPHLWHQAGNPRQGRQADDTKPRDPPVPR